MYSDTASQLYDICPGVDYSRIIKTISQIYPRPGRVYDVGCGTGTLLSELASRGWKCAGCDPSISMVDLARKKNSKAKIVRATALDFEVEERVNLVTCTSDVINHLPSDSAVSSFLTRACKSLYEGGGILFDCLTPHDINSNWSDYAQINRFERAYVIRTGKRLRLNTGELTYDFFIQSDNATWRHETEVHKLHTWPLNWIKGALRENGFGLAKIVDADTLKPVSKSTVRWLISAKKVK